MGKHRMNFGLTFSQAAPLQHVAEWWKALDRSRLHTMGVPDSPALMRELYVSMTVAALSTSRIRIISWVTNPITRHPSVAAAAFMALNELAPGRVAMGIATGDSALWATGGQHPAKVDQLRQYIRAVKSMMRGEETQWNGGTFKPNWTNWTPAEVPIYVACSGQKVLSMAAQEADGVIVMMGYAPETIRMFQDKVKTFALAVGRDPASVDFWCNAHLVPDSSREAAMEYSLGWTTNWLTEMTTKGKGIPDHLVDKVHEFNADIHDMDAVYKTKNRGKQLVERAKRLGVYDWLMSCSPQFFGRPEDIVKRLEHYGDLGLKNWYFLYSSRGAFIGGSDQEKYNLIDTLSNEIIPHFS